ncbi:MAG TPA: SRPBCC family protein [Solirubrobacterales bacterium]|nr:SRPBCC family protein [Solirubrobacterales bacterium]
MPEVDVTLAIEAPAERVWEAVLDIESYPAAMENVRSVRVLGADGEPGQRSAWSIVLKGSILEWEERDLIDEAAMEMRFHQLSGDLSEFDGFWRVRPDGPERSTARFAVTFEIGIPLLAEMLNPVATRSLEENCAEMLRGVERQAVAP